MIRNASAVTMQELRLILGSDERLLRMARIGAPILAVLAMLVVVVGLSPGPEPWTDRSGIILGHDLSQVWVAGKTALEGRPGDVYDIPRHNAELVRTFGAAAAPFGWHYPPTYFLVAGLLASLPYLAAIMLWGAGSFGLFGVALRVATRSGPATLIGLAHPLVFMSLSYGQNGLLTASLLTMGMALLDRRPTLAGILFGLVCYKPQLAALAPFLCVLTARWRVVGASTATVAVLAGLSAAVFGLESWTAFLASVPVTSTFILRDAAAGLDLNASAYGAVRLFGGPIPVAWTAQMIAAIAATTGCAIVWKRCGDHRLRTAVTLLAAPLVSPYVPIYDLAMIVPGSCLLAMAAAARGGLTTAERTFFIAGLLLTPALRGLTDTTGMPVGFAIAASGFAIALVRALPRPAPASSG